MPQLVMRVPALVMLATLAVCSAAAAQDYLILDPPVNPEQPVAGQPVSARIQDRNCAASEIAVVRQGNLIELRFVQGGCPVLPPISDFDLPLGTLPAGTYDMRLLEISNPANPFLTDEAVFTVDPAPCEANPNLPAVGLDHGLCIDGRFFVTAEWTSHDGSQGLGTPVPLTPRSGGFWFFGDDNIELMVKVLDACAYNGRSWVFAAGLTDVGVVLHVHDELTGADRTYTSRAGHSFPAIADTDAFACP